MTDIEAAAILAESKRQNETMRDHPGTFFPPQRMAEGVKNAERRIEAYSLAITALKRAAGWVSVKDRTPKTGTVLATDGRIVITAPSSSVTKDGPAITHWMPLPEPPGRGRCGRPLKGEGNAAD